MSTDASEGHMLTVTVKKTAVGSSAANGHCSCGGWFHASSGWTVESATENGIKPAHARHLRKIANQSTGGDKAYERAEAGFGLVVILFLVAAAVVIIFGLGRGYFGHRGDDSDDSNPDVPLGPCPALAERLQDHDDRDSPTWQKVNERFDSECL
ncbi:hypothetical protein JK386_17985 [Nocardioides sp. zg-536]|uniref:Uncharacterized protein n=1 Tax=Nocardioides faecalis TaxID=2803858 RepID=A0A939BX60_9ACTN|nr:hypothetical protein [Nocardioides faecalis]MBM9461786.1 hypothetical protein [Nocardioides faecalis]QVI60163.1 hypothetical protein KG111_07685 [Nocardioides faecalis]